MCKLINKPWVAQYTRITILSVYKIKYLYDTIMENMKIFFWQMLFVFDV